MLLKSITALLVAVLALPAQAAKLEVVHAWVVPPTEDVAGAKSISVSVGGNVGNEAAKQVREHIKSENFGKSTGFLGLKNPNKIAVFHTPVNINILSITSDAADLRMSGSAQGSATVNTEESRTRTDKDGNEYTVQCRSKTAMVNYSFKVTRSNGDHITEETDNREMKSGTACDKSASNAVKKLPSDAKMYSSIVSGATVSIVKAVMPHYAKRKTTLEKDKSTKDLTKSAKKAKSTDDLLEAGAKLNEVVSTDPYNYAAVFSLGGFNELIGDYTTALSLYEKASKLESNKRVKDSLAEIKVRISQAEDLTRYGLNVTGKAADIVIEERVALKGSSKDRIPLTTEPGGGDQIVAIPGGVQLVIIGQDGDYLKVRAPNGEEGWVASGDTKAVK